MHLLFPGTCIFTSKNILINKSKYTYKHFRNASYHYFYVMKYIGIAICVCIYMEIS